MELRPIRSVISPVLALLICAGCQTTRVVTISTKPADATVKVDGVERPRGKIVEAFVFTGSSDIHRVSAARKGYKDVIVPLNRDYTKKDLVIELKPQTRRVDLTVGPMPAIISIDGKPVDSEPKTAYSTELEFAVDAKDNIATHTITAERPNYQTATVTVSLADRSAYYPLKLEPLRKDLAITTNPPGATVYFDKQAIGTAIGNEPIKLAGQMFAEDPNTGKLEPHFLRATKAGYDDVVLPIGWDNGKSEYQIDLAAKTKQVRIATTPPGASVRIGEVEFDRDASGAAITTLQFPPTNDKGDLKTYEVMVEKTGADADWYPKTFTLAWDDGKGDYAVDLKEVLTRPVPLLTWNVERGVEDWIVLPKWITTIAMKDVAEGEQRPAAVQVTRLQPGTTLDTLEISPDGSQLILTTLHGKDRNDFRSQMMVVKTDGSGGSDLVSDGKTLDLCPSFSPGGEQIVFSSDRFGKRMSICSMAAAGTPGVTNLTSGDTSDLWPQIDADPKPRLFYQAMVGSRSGPRLYNTQLGTTFRTDLTQEGGSQPRISPRNDAVLFTSSNEVTNFRDIYRVSDRGGAPQNLTATKDFDESDPAWSRDGRKVAFASNRGTDKEAGANYDVWVLDLVKGGEPTQVTVNGSVDDRPVWDPAGNAIYFRSNRGGEWQVWKINVK